MVVVTTDYDPIYRFYSVDLETMGCLAAKLNKRPRNLVLSDYFKDWNLLEK